MNERILNVLVAIVAVVLGAYAALLVINLVKIYWR